MNKTYRLISSGTFVTEPVRHVFFKSGVQAVQQWSKQIPWSLAALCRHHTVSFVFIVSIVRPLTVVTYSALKLTWVWWFIVQWSDVCVRACVCACVTAWIWQCGSVTSDLLLVSQCMLTQSWTVKPCLLSGCSCVSPPVFLTCRPVKGFSWSQWGQKEQLWNGGYVFLWTAKHLTTLTG